MIFSQYIRSFICFLLIFSIAFAFEWTPSNQIPDGYSVIRFSRNISELESSPSPLGTRTNTKQWNYSGFIEIIGKFEQLQVSDYDKDYTFGKFRLKNATVRWDIDNVYADTAVTPSNNKPDKVCTGSQHFYSKGEAQLGELKYYYDDYSAQALVDFDSGNWQSIQRYESDKHPLLDLEIRKLDYSNPDSDYYRFLPVYHDGNFLLPVRSAPSAVGDCGSIPFSTTSKIIIFKYQIPIVADTSETSPVHLTGSKNYYSLGFKPYSNVLDITIPVEVNPDQVLAPAEDQPSWELFWDIKLAYTLASSTGNSDTDNGDSDNDTDSGVINNCNIYCSYDSDCCTGSICDPYNQICVQKTTPSTPDNPLEVLSGFGVAPLLCCPILVVIFVLVILYMRSRDKHS